MGKLKELEIVISSKYDKKPYRRAIIKLWFLVVGMFIRRVIIQSVKETFGYKKV